MKARQQQQRQRPDISKCKSDSVVPSGKHLYIDFQYIESVDVCWLTSLNHKRYHLRPVAFDRSRSVFLDHEHMSKIVSDCKLRRQFASQFTQEAWRQCNLPILDWHNSTTLQLDVPSDMTILTNQRSLLQHAVGSCVKICFNYSLSALTGRS